MPEELNLNLEAKAFSQRLKGRSDNNFIPDLKNYRDNDYFYKSFWRRKTYVDYYIGEMSNTYIQKFSACLPPESCILDFGCGPGYFSLELARAGFNVIAYDIADFCIDNARGYLKSINEPGLASKILFTNSLEDVMKYSYEGILCSGVLHHLPNLQDTVHSLVSYFKNPSKAVLVFHEPFHNSWKRQDAYIVAIIRSILSASNLWFEDYDYSDTTNFGKIVDSIFEEYVTERDPHEKGGQSPNDLSCDYVEIMSVLNQYFERVDTWPSRSFIYRVLGGIRADKITEDRLAKCLEIVDRFGIESGLLQPNYMYGFASSLKS